MKTAEEWIEETTGNPKCRLTTIGACSIEEIQLDAMKEGMRRAANMIRREIESCGCNGIDRNGCESCNAKDNSRTDIIMASEQLTIKDLEV